MLLLLQHASESLREVGRDIGTAQSNNRVLNLEHSFLIEPYQYLVYLYLIEQNLLFGGVERALPRCLARSEENGIDVSVRRGGDVSRRDVVFEEDDIEFLNNPAMKRIVYLFESLETKEKLFLSLSQA